MKRWKIIVVVTAAWCGLTVATVKFMAGGPTEDAMKRFDVLSAELEAVHDAYTRSIDPASPRAAHDPRLNVLAKMDRLAEAVAGTKDGAYIARETFGWSYMLDLDPPGLPGRFERLIEHHPDDAQTLDVVNKIPSAANEGGDQGAWIELLDRLTQNSGSQPVRLAAHSAIGRIHMQSGDAERAKTAFENLLQLAPDSEQADEARRYIFEIEHLQVGKPAPDFTATTLEGDEVSLASLRGKVVLLNFWATWCPTCISEIPHLREVAEKLADEPFQILAVSLDDSRSSAEMLIRAMKPPGIQTWHPAGRDNPVALRYNARILPTWYLIDAGGVIRARDPFGDKLMPAIEAALPQAPPSEPPSQPG